MVNTAFVFPGQGSQTVGMLADLIPKYSIITALFSQASEIVGYDLLQLVLQGPEEKLNQTEHTQVAMLTADVAVFELLMQQAVPMPQWMAGHSLGEYAALVAANAMSFTDAVVLVRSRAQVMQQAVPMGQGAMAAIVGLSDDEVSVLCKQASLKSELVSPANFNAIGQVVVAGHTQAVERLIQLAFDANARLARIIPVSVPCHCPLLREAAEVFADSLEKTPLRSPSVSVVSNVDLSIYQSAEHIRNNLQAQLYSPVRWVETIQLFKNKGIDFIIECGPGKVLNGLVKRIDKSLSIISVYDTISLNGVVTS
ncbi:MAG: ACP S-malonyltransferase [Legionella sp.]|nr:ACP S-malonyltransferase [Legionella sp.]